MSILLAVGIIVYMLYLIYNWNTPYEVKEYGAKGQVYGSGEYTTMASETMEILSFYLLLALVVAVAFIFKKLKG